jgi:hypothetical protein
VQKLRYAQFIAAPRRRVWEKTIDPVVYREWTAAFCPGSHFVGSWDEGAAIRFLGPGGGGGMVSEIAVHRPAEFLSIRHLGFIVDGVDDVSSDAVKSWAPSYENYSFLEVPGGTRVEVEVDTLDEFVDMMNECFPKALALLQSISERSD